MIFFEKEIGFLDLNLNRKKELKAKEGSTLKTLKSNNSVVMPFWIRLIAHFRVRKST